jgi:hypothetical protein
VRRRKGRQTKRAKKSSVRYLHDCDIGYIIMDLLLHVDPYSIFIRAALLSEPLHQIRKRIISITSSRHVCSRYFRRDGGGSSTFSPRSIACSHDLLQETNKNVAVPVNQSVSLVRHQSLHLSSPISAFSSIRCREGEAIVALVQLSSDETVERP